MEKMITLSCANCRKPVERPLRKVKYLSKSQDYHRIYCSHTCQGEWIKAHPSAGQRRPRKLVQFVCSNCGKEEERGATQARLRNWCEECRAKRDGEKQ